MDDVYQALIALCGISSAVLLVLGCVLGAYLYLKAYSLYIQLFKKDKNNDKEGE